MTLISNVNWKSGKKNQFPKDYYKAMFFLDQVYVIRKPEVFNGWICICIELDHSNRTQFGFGHPLMRTSGGEFIHDFNGFNKHYEFEYLGNINSGFNGFNL